MISTDIPQTTARALVVDDNIDAADMLSLLLAHCGCDVAVSYSGPDALDLADKLEPDLIFLDIGMPIMDGFETAMHMRLRAWGRTAFIVALTAFDDDTTKRRIKQSGIDAHLVKPTTFKRLVSILATARGRVPP